MRLILGDTYKKGPAGSLQGPWAFIRGWPWNFAYNFHIFERIARKVDIVAGLDASLIYESFKTQLHHFICPLQYISL